MTSGSLPQSGQSTIAICIIPRHNHTSSLADHLLRPSCSATASRQRLREVLPLLLLLLLLSYHTAV